MTSTPRLLKPESLKLSRMISFILELENDCCGRCLPTSLLWSRFKDKSGGILFVWSLGEVIKSDFTGELKHYI